MKRIVLVLIASMMLLPVIPFAQTTPQPPASWVAFQKEESAKRAALFQQLKSDREAFLSSHPDVQAYFDQLKANAQTRMAEWKAKHPNSTSRFARINP